MKRSLAFIALVSFTSLFAQQGQQGRGGGGAGAPARVPSIEERTTGLNRLIRGELSAVETYRQALDKMKDAPEAIELHALMVEHRAAVQRLREQVSHHGGNPANTSGPEEAPVSVTVVLPNR